MKKTISVFIGFFLILLMFGCASIQVKSVSEREKEVKPLAEFEAVLCEVVQTERISHYFMWILRFDNNMVVSILINYESGAGRQTTWFVGKRYRIWTEDTFNIISGGGEWHAELMELVGIPMIDQEVKKRLNRIKESKKIKKRD